MSIGGFHFQQGDYRLEAIKGTGGMTALTVGSALHAQTITIPPDQASRLCGWLTAALAGREKAEEPGRTKSFCTCPLCTDWGTGFIPKAAQLSTSYDFMSEVVGEFRPAVGEATVSDTMRHPGPGGAPVGEVDWASLPKFIMTPEQRAAFDEAVPPDETDEADGDYLSDLIGEVCDEMNAKAGPIKPPVGETADLTDDPRWQAGYDQARVDASDRALAEPDMVALRRWAVEQTHGAGGSWARIGECAALLDYMLNGTIPD